jgi:hypothetical protein
VAKNLAKRDIDTGRFAAAKSDTPSPQGTRRVVLFPTERSTVGHKKIDRAIERVIARKK